MTENTTVLPSTHKAHTSFITSHKRLMETVGIDINHAALADFAKSDLFADPQLPNWDYVLHNPSQDHAAPKMEELYNLLLFAALNGGYYYQDEPFGEIKQWQKDGSGAKAYLEWLSGVYKSKTVPGIDIYGRSDIHKAMDKTISKQPYSWKRIACIQEFSRGGYDRFTRLMNNIIEQDPQSRSFGWTIIDYLADIYPMTFADDPFYKRAILFCMMASAYLAQRGIENRFELPVAADYQLPRNLIFNNVLEFTDPSIEDELRAHMLEEDSLIISTIRYKTIEACRLIGTQTGYDSRFVDAALWFSMRKNPAFEKANITPIRVHGIWF